MRAVLFRPSRTRRGVARALGGLPRSLRWGRLSGLSLEEMPDPVLPGPEWVRLQVLKAGIGRRELRALAHDTSALLEPFTSWPAVPGGEILGRVVEAGAEVRGFEPDARIVVAPFLSCAARGFAADPCPACVRGLPAGCARAGEEGALEVGGRSLRRGACLGAHADLPGGWSEQVLAHRSQLLPVDDVLPDRVAVLVEPLASALHAVGAAGIGAHAPRVRAPRPALVLGGGARGLGTVLALRVLGFAGQVVARVDRAVEEPLARRLGATRVATDDASLREAMVDTGASAYMSVDAEEVWAGGGFDPVVDWTGGGSAPALRWVAVGGRLVLPASGAGASSAGFADGTVGLAAAREVTLVGAAGHGPRSVYVPGSSSFRLAHRVLLRDPEAVAGMVTHVYPLRQFREALDAAAGRGREEPVKVLLDPGV